MVTAQRSTPAHIPLLSQTSRGKEPHAILQPRMQWATQVTEQVLVADREIPAPPEASSPSGTICKEMSFQGQWVACIPGEPRNITPTFAGQAQQDSHQTTLTAAARWRSSALTMQSWSGAGYSDSPNLWVLAAVHRFVHPQLKNSSLADGSPVTWRCTHLILCRHYPLPPFLGLPSLCHYIVLPLNYI